MNIIKYGSDARRSCNLLVFSFLRVAFSNSKLDGCPAVTQRNQDYHYDVNGRLAKKIVHTCGFRPREWRYLWNTQNQLTACFTPKGDC